MGLRVARDLDDAGAVAQVKEDERAMVAAPVHPSRECDGLTGVREPQVAAVDGFEHPAARHG
jgi:hypothetical protein